jgi:hypothetical protein
MMSEPAHRSFSAGEWGVLSEELVFWNLFFGIWILNSFVAGLLKREAE